MSLQVWLPLNGDFNNQGLKQVKIINNGTTFDTNGKIGQCCNIASGQYLGFDAANQNNHKYPYISIACWVYPTQNDSTERNVICCYESGGCGINLKNSKLWAQVYVGGYKNCSTPTTITLNSWHHICMTYNGSKLCLYLNGQLVSSLAVSGPITYHNTCPWQIAGNPGATAFGSNNFIGKINDFRMYDHALSSKEVEEISKGLILHYKLDNIFNDNIIYDCSGYKNNGIINGTITINTFTPRYSNSMNFNGSYISTQSPSNEIKTISLWVKWDTIPSGQSVVYVDYKSKTGLGLMSKGILCSSCGLNSYTFNKSSIIANTWYHFVIINPNGADNSTRKLYINGVEQVATSNTSNWTYAIDELQIGKRSTTSDGMIGSISDFRMYATMLTETQIKELYNTGLSIDNSQKIHTFELEETNPNLFAGIPWTQRYSFHSKTYSLKTDFNENGEYIFTSNIISAGSDYIEIEPGIYEYDITISVNTGNQFYIGFHRYDANKTSRSDNACTYIISIKPTTDIVKKRYKGTVNLSTDGTNPCKYISLRILNGWSGTTSGVTGQSTIHNLSLRKQSNINSPSITKKGQLICDEFKEDAITSIYKNGIVESLNIIEN